jgi:hypothetical protein
MSIEARERRKDDGVAGALFPEKPSAAIFFLEAHIGRSGHRLARLCP